MITLEINLIGNQGEVKKNFIAGAWLFTTFLHNLYQEMTTMGVIFIITISSWLKKD